MKALLVEPPTIFVARLQEQEQIFLSWSSRTVPTSMGRKIFRKVWLDGTGYLVRYIPTELIGYFLDRDRGFLDENGIFTFNEGEV